MKIFLREVKCLMHQIGVRLVCQLKTTWVVCHLRIFAQTYCKNKCRGMKIFLRKLYASESMKIDQNSLYRIIILMHYSGVPTERIYISH